MERASVELEYYQIDAWSLTAGHLSLTNDAGTSSIQYKLLDELNADLELCVQSNTHQKTKLRIKMTKLNYGKN